MKENIFLQLQATASAWFENRIKWAACVSLKLIIEEFHEAATGQYFGMAIVQCFSFDTQVAAADAFAARGDANDHSSLAASPLRHNDPCQHFVSTDILVVFHDALVRALNQPVHDKHINQGALTYS